MTRIAGYAVRTVICLASIAWALDPAFLGAARRPPSPATLPGRAALVVEGDPPPGRTSATAAGSDAAGQMAPDPAFTRSTEGLELQMFPDGSRRVDLQGRFRSYSVVTLSADGRLTMACVDDPASALELARSAALRPPAARAPRRAHAVFGPQED